MDMRNILLTTALFFTIAAKGQDTIPAYLTAHRYDSAEAILTTVYNEDQAYRGGIDSIQKKYGWQSARMNALWSVIRKTDSIDLLKVRSSLDRYGWLSIDDIGERASTAQFLVIQHSDSLTQVTYLPMLREAVKKGKAQPGHLALLEDRILCTQGKPQIYGSQVRTNTKGKYEFFPIEDETNVNKRRVAVGLEPLENYARGFGFEYHPPSPH